MPAGSGHGFVQLVSCGLRAALFYDLLSAPGAEEQDFALCGARPRLCLWNPRFFEKNRVKLYLCNLSISVTFIDTLRGRSEERPPLV